METLEKLSKAFDLRLKASKFCNEGENATEEEQKNWKARIDGIDGVTCSGTKLYKNMAKAYAKEDGAYVTRDKEAAEFLSGGPIAFVPKDEVYEWDKHETEDAIRPDHFPIQAHHLIPKRHLPTHPVCELLTPKHEGAIFVLTGDAPYNTDGVANGYCLPEALRLMEWQKAKTEADKQKVAEKVMEGTGRQLHQGKHTDKPLTSDDEEPEIHSEVGNGPYGYLRAVDRLLGVVYRRTLEHIVYNCPNDCRSREDPRRIRPLKSTVKHINQVSGLIKVFIDSHRIHVCKRAARYCTPDKATKSLEKPDWMK